MGGKNSLICYITEKYPFLEALEKNKKTNYFKLTLPHTGSKLQVTLWASVTPKQFILYVHSAIYACKQKEHDVTFSIAEEVVATAQLDLEIKREEYAQVHSAEK
jgi:hypothetical protein